MRRVSRRLASLAAAALLGGCEGVAAPPELSGSATSEIQSIARPTLRVRVSRAEAGSLDRRSSLSGVVRAFRRAQIAAETAGRVVERRAEPGDRVESGVSLLALDDSRLHLALEEARANLAAREVDLAEAARERERGEGLYARQAISEKRRDEIEFAVRRARSARDLADAAMRRAQRNLADARIAAPFAGSVEAVHVDVGDYVRPGTPVADLIDLSRARLQAGVTGAEATHFAVGDAAIALFEDLGGLGFEGVVRSVGRVADPGTGTYPLEIWLDNGGGKLREGMVASLSLTADVGSGAAAATLVPQSALVRRDGRLAIFVVGEADRGPRVNLREVRIGHSDGDRVEVLAGVDPGETVVIEGQFALRDGSDVFVETGSGS